MHQDRNTLCAATVMVVDDEEDIVTYLVTLLQDNGYEAVGVCDAAAALRAVNAHPPDLILLDIMMPGQSGLSLYQRLRASGVPAEIPIIFMSGCRRIEELGELPDGMNIEIAESSHYLEKPVRIEELLQRIRELLPWMQEVVL